MLLIQLAFGLDWWRHPGPTIKLVLVPTHGPLVELAVKYDKRRGKIYKTREGRGGGSGHADPNP